MESFDPVQAVLISEEDGNLTQITLNINDCSKYVKGSCTFIGQWPDIDVVIIKCDKTPFDLMMNRNTLPPPFENEIVLGPILLVRMDENSEPRDFTLSEYSEYMHSLQAQPARTSNLV